nr:helix-turn-helix transcriptional regulator [uncultured Shimia sp.]
MNEQVKQNIGQRVKAARLQRGHTQADLAEAIEKAFETISNIERGKTAPNFSTLSDIAAALEVPLKSFFDFGDEDLPEERQAVLMQLNSMIGQMDDAKLNLLLKLGRVLNED